MSFERLFPLTDHKLAIGCRHVVCFSGGESSALVAVEVVRKYGRKNSVLLNHDINESVEDADIKRFKAEVADYLRLPVTCANMVGVETMDQFDVVLKAGSFRTPRGDALCTSRLKTDPFRKWLTDEIPDANCVVYYGFSADEPQRIQRRSQIMGVLGYKTAYPLAQWDRTITSIRELGIAPPLTYGVFKHANCVGCLKAGVQHWYIVYCTRADIWEKAKETEVEMGYSILKEGALETLECKFSLMKAAGVPATERCSAAKFWRSTHIVVGNYLQQNTDVMPCECSI